jgi:predicted DNA-binding transcriptional regulator AlpA
MRHTTRPKGAKRDNVLVGYGAAAKATGLSISTIRRKLKDPTDDFPRPARFASRIIKFVESDLVTWREAKIAARGKRSRVA